MLWTVIKVGGLMGYVTPAWIGKRLLEQKPMSGICSARAQEHRHRVQYVMIVTHSLCLRCSCACGLFFFVVIAVVVFWSGDLLFTHQNWKGGAKDHRNKNCNFVSVGFCFLLLCQEIFFFFLR